MKTLEQREREHIAQKKYRERNTEKRREYNRKWRKAHPEYAKEKWAKYSVEKRDELKAKQNAYYHANREARRAAVREQTLKRKLEVIKVYGGKCACCGETQYQFLTIDHINGGGAKHVRAVGRGRGHDFYRWLREQGYPQDQFQLLCWNCNAAKGIMGGCPHGEFGLEYGLSGC